MQYEDEDDLSPIVIPSEAFMNEVPNTSAGSRRDEDIALDMMKFIAMTTGYGKTSVSGVGFQGGGAAAKPEEYAGHVAHWHADGASIVGGCCGTGPEHIQWLRRMMDEAAEE